jgi:predicted dehydrogenase
VASLHNCWTQSLAQTPRPVWNAERDEKADHYKSWTRVEESRPFVHSFRPGWEMFLRAVADEEPFPFGFEQGVRALALIDAAHLSAREKRAVSVSKV